MIDKFKPMGSIVGDKNVLQNKPKQNPKYKGVKKTLNTGLTVNDVETVTDKQLAKQKSELYQRIKVQTLNELLQQNNENEESLENLIKQEVTPQFDNMSIATVQSSSTQKSECTLVKQVVSENQQGNCEEHPFLLLDCRVEDRFEEFHIQEAFNFPEYKLKQDKFLPIIYKYKNKPKKLIIVYCFDEKEGIPVANLFFEKGFDNVYLLSGGIEKFSTRYPNLVEGKIPDQIKKQTEQNLKEETQSKISQRTNKETQSKKPEKSKESFISKNKKTIQNQSEINSVANSKISSSAKISKK